MRIIFEHRVNPVSGHLVNCSSNFKNGTLVTWQISDHFEKCHAYTQTQEKSEMLSTYSLISYFLTETTIINAVQNQGFHRCCPCHLTELWGAVTSAHLKTIMPGLYFTRALPPLHCQTLISVERVCAAAPTCIARGQRKELSAQVRDVRI
jgi:hypothetical protein